MTEKVITLYDTKNKRIAGVLIVSELGDGYIDGRIVLYAEKPVQNAILPILRGFAQKSITIPFITKRIAMWLKTSAETESITLLEPFTLASDNKNKSSRNKRMIEQLNLPCKLERSCACYGKESY